MNSLNYLKNFSTVVVDTGDVTLIDKFLPEDVTTNPSLILNSWHLNQYKKIINKAIIYSKRKGMDEKNTINFIIRKLSIGIGVELLKKIPGYVSTEISAKFSFNKLQCIEEAKRIIEMYEEENIDKSRILIKLAATWEGIKASEELEKLNIKCNLTLLFSFAQAKACAESGVFLISPFVGRISDWYNIHYPTKLEFYNAKKDEGVRSVVKIFNYYKENGYKTIIMAASFRNIEQILELSGCDKLTISPILLDKLINSSKKIEKKLFSNSKVNMVRPKKLSRSNFLWEHNLDPMAVEKLSEGIRQFAEDQRKLEKIIISNFF
ncbi:Transaldolase A [Buchnera aphidicola (Tetraneura ulmi)]|uniref:transaldolase n=1 Tax=Buchnera aphidicola TaxID=9 RepID=UPI0034647463